MKRCSVISLLLVPLILFSCTDRDDLLEVDHADWQTLVIGDYEMQVPQDFVLVEGSGFDSYIGTIEGAGIKLAFDYGSWNVPPQNLPPEKFRVVFEKFGSVERYIVIAKNSGADRTGIHIRDLNDVRHGNYVSLNMSTGNLSQEQQDLVLRILDTVSLTE